MKENPNDPNKLVLPNLSYGIMGVLFKVHNELGPTLLEKYYQRAVARELADNGLRFERELPTEITYRGKSIGRYRVDFLIENLVVLEIKAEKRSSNQHLKQVMAYLRQLDKPLAIVANFRRRRLSYQRIVNSAFKGKDLSKLDAKYSGNLGVKDSSNSRA